MGAFDKLLGRFKLKKMLGSWFQMLNGYSPVWTSYDGGVYEMELTRGCIHTFANHCSKLQPQVTCPDTKRIQAILDGKVNMFMTCAQFVYKIATIYEAKNTCFIVPILDQFDRIVGYYPVNPEQTELWEEAGEPYLVYTFANGEKAAVELSRVGVVSKFLYNNDLIGEDNSALNTTLSLMHTQNQGIEEGIKNSASYRFMAIMSNFSSSKDLKKKREEWVEQNMSVGSGGLALFPNTFSNVQQIQSAAKVVDPEQMKLIDNRVFTYFGANSKILLNEATGDDWAAYYEGKIEPFALQLSQALTMMTYTQAERSRQNKNAIIWTANRLQYMTNADKLRVSSQMFDRGIFSLNQVLDIWNLPHVENGDKRYIRKEYTEITQLDQVTELQKQLTAAQNQLNATKKPPDPPNDGNGGPKEGENNDPEQQD